jgi:adenylyltransferase/sulfurtransferase
MEVCPEELHEIMQRPGPRAFQLVDVRDGDDFVFSRLDWAELIPLDRFKREAPIRLLNKKEPIVIYCRDGVISERACEWLETQGYEFVFHLTGGLEEWREKVDPAFPLQRHESPESSQPMTPGSSAFSTAGHPSHAAASRSPVSASHGEVSPEELREFMSRPGPRSFRLIDVREEDEFQICRLEWAELIPLAQVPEQAPRRLVDKDRTIIVYCHHGMRSQRACEWLRHAGYEQVFNLTGGIEAWADRVEPTMRRY